MPNFDDLAMAVASFGGNNAVKFDDLGMPSIMVGIPKMKYSDIITGFESFVNSEEYQTICREKAGRQKFESFVNSKVV